MKAEASGATLIAALRRMIAKRRETNNAPPGQVLLLEELLWELENGKD